MKSQILTFIKRYVQINDQTKSVTEYVIYGSGKAWFYFSSIHWITNCLPGRYWVSTSGHLYSPEQLWQQRRERRVEIQGPAALSQEL